jgi:hypothetical protein
MGRLGSNRGSRICSTLLGFRNRSVPFVLSGAERVFSFGRFVPLAPTTVRYGGSVSRMCPACRVNPLRGEMPGYFEQMLVPAIAELKGSNP